MFFYRLLREAYEHVSAYSRLLHKTADYSIPIAEKKDSLLSSSCIGRFDRRCTGGVAEFFLGCRLAAVSAAYRHTLQS